MYIVSTWVLLIVSVSANRQFHLHSRYFEKIRGGGYLYEENPNYVPTPRQIVNSQIATLGDIPSSPQSPGFYIHTQTLKDSRPSQSTSFSQRGKDYVSKLLQESPSLAALLFSNLAVFCLWRIPTIQAFLGRHFVASKHNLLSGRFHSLLLSSISHIGVIHLLFNLLALLSFGPVVQRTIAETVRWPLYPFLLGSAVAGSLTFLLFHWKEGRGCLGLSGVTMSLVALFCRYYPQRTMNMLLFGIIPIKVRASNLLQTLLILSVFGSVINMRDQVVAHAAHLGGIIFGIAYHEVWRRKIVDQQQALFFNNQI